MAKRKKKDRFYVEQLFEWYDNRKAWLSWSQKNKSKQEVCFVKNMMNRMSQDNAMTAKQELYLDGDSLKVSFIVYRYWP